MIYKLRLRKELETAVEENMNSTLSKYYVNENEQEYKGANWNNNTSSLGQDCIEV